MARGDKVGNHCSRETNSQQYCSFLRYEVSLTRTARWTISAPFNLFYYARFYQAIKACVYHKITSFQSFILNFWCIFISSKPAKRLFLLIHPQFSNIVIFGEEPKLLLFPMSDVWVFASTPDSWRRFVASRCFSTSDVLPGWFLTYSSLS